MRAFVFNLFRTMYKLNHVNPKKSEYNCVKTESMMKFRL